MLPVSMAPCARPPVVHPPLNQPSWLRFNGTHNDFGFCFARSASFLAIIPLAKLLAWGTEELSLRVGETLGGLLNATRKWYYVICFLNADDSNHVCIVGNVVELIVGVSLLLHSGALIHTWLLHHRDVI